MFCIVYDTDKRIITVILPEYVYILIRIKISNNIYKQQRFYISTVNLSKLFYLNIQVLFDLSKLTLNKYLYVYSEKNCGIHGKY